jgi:hypothetical protein
VATACGGPSPGDGASPATPASSADRQPIGVYTVHLTGTVSGHDFARDGRIEVRTTVTAAGTTNGVNPYDVCLKSGFPGAAPEVGAIWFGTNSACFAATAQIDLASTEVSGSTYVARPDPSVEGVGVNGWTAQDGSVACIYVPNGGSATYEFHDDGTVTGHLDLTGFVAVCGSIGTQSTFTAELTGSRAG